MNNFIFENTTKVFFGKGCVKEYLACLTKNFEGTVMLAYGGGSIKKNGIYDEVVEIVKAEGTGAEMNNGAVITNEETNEKAGVLGAYASFAVLDVDYTMSLPAKQVLSGAFDTLSHSMETYLGSPRDITLSDEIAEAVMRNVIRNIRLLLKDINDKEARTELMWASAMAENGILKIGKVTDFQAH